MKPILKALRLPLIAAFWIGVWALSAHLVSKPLLFPSPAAVAVRWFELMQTPDFYRITASSLQNVLVGILTALALGIVLAAITSYVPLLRELLLPLMSVIKATPVASFIILALIWLGSARVPTFITVLIVLPVVWTNLDTAVKTIDPALREVTRVYRFSPFRRLRLLILPSVKPYFISACRTSLGLAWKAGIAAEIIAMPKKTIGTMIGEAKMYIMTEDMYAWTLTVILLSLLIEFVFSSLFRLADRRQLKAKEDVRC